MNKKDRPEGGKVRVFQRWLLLGLFILIPSQLALHFWPDWAFVFGTRIDYLSPTVYLTDILVVLLILTNLRVLKRYIGAIFLIFIFAAVNTFFSSSPTVSLVKWAKIIELSCFGLYIANQKTVGLKSVCLALFGSAVFFSLIGIAQFLKGGTLGTAFYFLGERSFSASTPGIALVAIKGQEFLRAYSTFSHPNSFAGYLGVVIIFSLVYLSKAKFFLPGIIVLLLALVLTFSLSSFIAITLATLYLFFWRGKIGESFVRSIFVGILFVSLILPIATQKINTNLPKNLSERLTLTFLSGKMIAGRFLIGEGANTFIINIPAYRGEYPYSWFLQPVHNIFLLTFAETGASGLLFFCYGIFHALSASIKKQNRALVACILFILITGFADHYWLTLQQNLLALLFVIGLSLAKPISRT